MQILHKLACKRKNIVSFKDMLQNLFNFDAAAVLDTKHYFLQKQKRSVGKENGEYLKEKILKNVPRTSFYLVHSSNEN